jgi:4-diphosphocytidyl-2-C-methyl-D-erythritol kinase
LNVAVARKGDAIEALAPAKVNLYLEVLGRRADGYHELCTVMMAVDLADRLRMERSDARGMTLSVRDPQLATDNLVQRAWELFAERCRPAGGVRIALQKSIPVGAGLGGGSSDAAAALAGLNVLLEAGLAPEQLAALGARVGSDVPFFLASGSLAICRGRGERVEPIDSPARPHGVLVVPPFSCSTGAVYAEYDRAGQTVGGRAEAERLAAFAGEAASWGQGLHNALEPAARRVEPRLGEMRRELEALSPAGLVMTGSGSGWFCLCADAQEASRLQEAVGTRGLGCAYPVHRWNSGCASGNSGPGPSRATTDAQRSFP